MQYIYPLNGVYHTHMHGDFTSWHDAHGWDASCTTAHLEQQQDLDWVREEASDHLYTWILEQDLNTLFICAASARAQVSFELDAYLDDEPVACSRTYKRARMHDFDAWGTMAEHRDRKRYRGGRRRGVVQHNVVSNGHVMGVWLPVTEAHDSWKNNRAYQQHGRCITPPLPMLNWGNNI